MRLTVIGSSGSFAGPASPASCYLISASTAEREWTVVVDLGNGALGPLQRFVDLDRLDAVVLTHLHPDHCADLTGLYVTRKYRPTGPVPGRLPVHGPVGTGDRLAAMYHGIDEGSLDAHFAFPTVRDRVPIHVGPLTITPFAMNHPVEAYGYRVSNGRVTISLTGDTDSTDNLLPLLTGADLVLMDSAFVEGRDLARGIHLTGRRAAEAAVAAGGVKRFMLTHIPAWNDPEECRAQAAQVWEGPVELAAAGDVHDL